MDRLCLADRGAARQTVVVESRLTLPYLAKPISSQMSEFPRKRHRRGGHGHDDRDGVLSAARQGVSAETARERRPRILLAAFVVFATLQFASLALGNAKLETKRA